MQFIRARYMGAHLSLYSRDALQFSKNRELFPAQPDHPRVHTSTSPENSFVDPADGLTEVTLPLLSV